MSEDEFLKLAGIGFMVEIDEFFVLLWRWIEQSAKGFDAGGALLNGAEASGGEPIALARKCMVVASFVKLQRDVLAEDAVVLSLYEKDGLYRVDSALREDHRHLSEGVTAWAVIHANDGIASFELMMRAHGCTCERAPETEGGVSASGLLVIAGGANDDEWEFWLAGPDLIPELNGATAPLLGLPACGAALSGGKS